MTESQDVLVPSLRNNSSVEPPYSNAQISETVTHREILRIYRMARPETKVVYDLGRDTDRVEEENWVIRWMLWHVFRYRDSRNRNRRHISPSPERVQAPNPSIASIAGGHSSRKLKHESQTCRKLIQRLRIACSPTELLLGPCSKPMVLQMTPAEHARSRSHKCEGTASTFNTGPGWKNESCAPGIPYQRLSSGARK